VKLIAFGQAPVGVIAIGQVPTGVVAIGQGARGVFVVGQLACGVIAFGQLAVGVVAFGQLALGAGWAGGMMSVAPVRGWSLLGVGPLGELGLNDLFRGRWRRFRRSRPRTFGRLAAGAALVAGLAIVWWGGVAPTIDELRHDDPPTEEGPRVLR
jgi:hypothetical protein